MDNSVVNELVDKKAFDQLDKLGVSIQGTIDKVGELNKADLVGKKAFTQLDKLMADFQKAIEVLELFNSKVAAAQGAMKAAKSFEEMAKAEEKAQEALEGVTKAQQVYVQGEKAVTAAVKATSSAVEEGVKALNQSTSSRESLIRVMTAQKLELDAIKQQQRQLTKEYQQGKITTDKYRDSLAALESARNYGATALAKYRQELNILTKEEMATDSSFREREQTLARLKNLYKDLSDAMVANPEVGGRLKAAIDELDASVKNFGGTIGEHQRNVGNYAITAKTLQGELLQLKNILAQLYNDGKGTSQEAEEVRQRIEALSTSVNKVTKETKMLRSQTRTFDALLQGAQAAASAFGVYKSTLTLIGIEGEKAEKATQKLAAVIALITSLQQIQRLMVERNALSWALLTAKQKLYNVVVGQTTGALKALRIALAATIGGAIVLGIIYLASNWSRLKDAIAGTGSEQRLYNEIAQKTSEYINEEGKQLSTLTNKVLQSAEGTKARKDAVEEFNKTYGNYLTNLLTEKATVDDIKQAYDELVPVLIQQSTLRAANNKLDEYIGRKIDLTKTYANAQEQLNKAQQEFNKFSADTPEYETVVNVRGSLSGGSVGVAPTAKGFAKMELDKAAKDFAVVEKQMNDLEGDISSVGEVAANTAAKLNELFKGTYDASSSQKKAVEDQKKLQLEIAKTTAEIDKLANQQWSDERKATAEDVKKGYQDRMIAVHGYAALREEQIERELKAEIAAAEASTKNTELKALRIRLAEEKAALQRIALKKSVDDAIEKIDGDTTKQLIRNVQERIDEETDRLEKLAQQELEELSGMYAAGLVKKDEYDRHKNEIQLKYSQEALNFELDLLENELMALATTEEEKEKVRQKFRELRKKRDKEVSDSEVKENEEAGDKLGKATKAKYEKLADDFYKKAKDIQENHALLIEEAVAFASAMLNASFEKRQRALDREIELVERQKDREIEAIKASTDTEEEKQRRITAAEAQAAAKSEALERRKQQLARQQAVFQKALMAAETIAATALAVTKALPNIPLSLIIAGLGAAQLATILATPIPAYEKGTDDHSGGLALVGEKRRELIITPDGKLLLTADRPQLVDLPKHTQVLPDANLALQLLTESLPAHQGAVDVSRIEQGLARVEKAVLGSKANLSVNLDRNGVYRISESGTKGKRYVNQSMK